MSAHVTSGDFDAAVRQHQAGSLDAAARLYGEVLARDPDHADALRLMGVLHHQRGDGDAAERLIRQAIAASPRNGKAYDNLALVLNDRGAKDEALAALDRAVALNPTSEASHFSRANLLAELGRNESAIEAYSTAIALNPCNAAAHLGLGGLLLKCGDAREALDHINESLELLPGDATALSYRTIALSEVGDLTALNHLVDFDHFIRCVHVGERLRRPLPEFNAALARHIETHPTLRQVPSTVNGHDTKELLGDGNQLTALLGQFIVGEIAAYDECIPIDPMHPLNAGRPRRHRIESWGVVMWSQGYQVAHIHKKAWISGVYYVQLPSIVAADQPGNDGWIEFGHGPTDLYTKSSPPVRRIRPVEGMLITFPSYLWHRTIPFDSTQRRICISFDVIPV